MKKVYDYGVGVGGPIVRDRLWFYCVDRFWGGQNAGANNYFNKSPVFYRYEPDLSRPAYTDSWQATVGGRFTLQASEKHKITLDPEVAARVQLLAGHQLWARTVARRRAPASIRVQRGERRWNGSRRRPGAIRRPTACCSRRARSS